MKRLLAFTAVLLTSTVAFGATSIGVISYWGTDAALYDQLPEGATALINPDNGIFVSAAQTNTLVPNLADYQAIVAKAAKRDITMLGYVPTGYFKHSCNESGKCQTWDRIEAQVKAYFRHVPKLEGIFFDEAAPALWDCNAFPAEYQRLRDIVYQYNGRATIAFNAGVPDNCAVKGADPGDILVLFENDQSAYAAQADNIKWSTLAAVAKGVTTWHLVHSVKTAADLASVTAQAKSLNVDLFYATSIGGNWQAGDNTWGSLPPYWKQEVDLLTASNDQAPSCSALGAMTAGQTVAKASWTDIGKTGYIYIGAKGQDGATWMHDGRQWTAYRSGSSNRSVYTTSTLTGTLSVSNQSVAQLLVGLPAGAKSIWIAYATADERDALRGRQKICMVK